jgi:hypothetical protein
MGDLSGAAQSGRKSTASSTMRCTDCWAATRAVRARQPWRPSCHRAHRRPDRGPPDGLQVLGPADEGERFPSATERESWGLSDAWALCPLLRRPGHSRGLMVYVFPSPAGLAQAHRLPSRQISDLESGWGVQFCCIGRPWSRGDVRGFVLWLIIKIGMLTIAAGGTLPGVCRFSSRGGQPGLCSISPWLREPARRRLG